MDSEVEYKPLWLQSRKMFFSDPRIQETRRTKRLWSYIKLPERLFESKCNGLLKIIGPAMLVYMDILAHVTRGNKSTWGEIGPLYQKGLLVTFRTQRNIADDLGIHHTHVNGLVKILKEYNFLTTDIRHWTGTNGSQQHGTFYCVGFWEWDDSGKIRIEYPYSYIAVQDWVDSH